MNYIKRFRIKHFILFALLIGLDQVVKHLVRAELHSRDIRLIPDILQLTYVQNTGAGFGIFKNQVLPLTIMGLILLLAIFWYYLRIPKEKKYMPIVYVVVFIAAGAVGNLIDRIRYGFVTDFIYFELINFPVFNIADIYITTSSCLLIFLILFYYKDEEFDFLSFRLSKKSTSDKTHTDNGKNNEDETIMKQN